MKFQKKTKVNTQIPTASLPDIVFMLIFFFMVSTVLRVYTGLTVDLPDAEKVQAIESRSHTSYIWIGRDGTTSYNDIIIHEIQDLYNIAYETRVNDPQTLISLKIDRMVPMRSIMEVQSELRKADLLKVNYATRIKVR